jgi:hypothetical protein
MDGVLVIFTSRVEDGAKRLIPGNGQPNGDHLPHLVQMFALKRTKN